MKHPLKRRLALYLAAILLLSGIQTKSAIFSSIRPFQTSSHAPAVHSIVYWLYHDVSAEESLGTRSARLVLEHCMRSRSKGFCRMPDLLYSISRADTASCPPVPAAVLHRQEREPYTVSWIIHYIHDQDGEKEGARPLI